MVVPTATVVDSFVGLVTLNALVVIDGPTSQIVGHEQVLPRSAFQTDPLPAICFLDFHTRVKR
jgi:hypothetical protein